jgi:hypothetical protein
LDILKSERLVNDKENILLTPSHAYTPFVFHINFLWWFAKIVTRQDENTTRIKYMIQKDKDYTQI